MSHKDVGGSGCANVYSIGNNTTNTSQNVQDAVFMEYYKQYCRTYEYNMRP